MTKARSIILNSFLVVMISLSLLWINVLQRQHEQYRRGAAAWQRGDAIAAIAGYESAIHMYSPGSPTVEKAAQALWNIGRTMEMKGDRERALIAYRSLRSAYLAARWLIRPGQGWIARCDQKIAAISAAGPAEGRR